MHEVIREESLKSWAEVQEGKANPLAKLLSENESIRKYMTSDEVLSCLDASNYYGDSDEICETIVNGK
jgi:adenylosuccinate lyase